MLNRTGFICINTIKQSAQDHNATGGVWEDNWVTSKQFQIMKCKNYYGKEKFKIDQL